MLQPKPKPGQSPSNTPNIELQARDLKILKGRFGKSEPKEMPFRVIVSLAYEAPRNNVAEALLRMRNPLLRLIWITTRTQIEADPFAPIYLTPLPCRQAVDGSAHEIERVRPEELKQAVRRVMVWWRCG